ncbi:restriction endonuclease subunit S [Ligilactobacillus salivarius]|uniref:restriction endonuclease subunit S n=1 Tax=Ligilactobacillus salivarius TaxID=1624 RepID=UPI002963E284|nr:restriction endonuclease subunit S [Ligilactobacillus salivarius]WOX35953.1 restriction endonuclease subunit S [Ligilactobacillus salivarius]
MAKEEKKAPKLRFNGYTNDWEQQELGAVVEFYSGLTYKPENVVQNGTLVIRSSNIHNNQYINADNVYVKNNIVNSEYVQEQDIVVVVRNGSRNLIGKHALLKSIPHDPSVIGAFMTGIRSLNNQFIEAVLNTEKFKREINKNLGATINQITTSQFKKMKFNFPKREEDKQIGILFNYLDDTIQLHERKCEELILIKKALLQKLFPKKDKVRPEVRYKNFSDAWKQRKLGDYLSIPAKEPITDINKLKLMTLKLNLEGITLAANRETLKLGSTKYYKRHEGQLLYGKQNFFHGSIALIPKEAEGYATSGDVPALNISNINSKYLVDYISRPIYFETKEALATGTGSKRIHEKTLLNFKIAVPSLEEQSEISDFIAKYTALIALHQSKLEKLKKMKKFLLQNMFI